METGIFDQVVSDVGRAIDAVGVAVIAICAVVQLTRYVRAFVQHRSASLYGSVREGVGRGVLLGLEILVGGDIVRTVGANPTLGSLAILATIVGVRTFLSFTIGVETEKRWPWVPQSPEGLPER